MIALLLAIVLSGCVTTRYEWRREGIVADYYRWVVLSRRDFPLACGFIPPDTRGSWGACAVRLKQGVVLPTDKEIATGIADGEYKVAPLCLIYGTLDEEEARRMWIDGESARDHEVRHCRGEVHG